MWYAPGAARRRHGYNGIIDSYSEQELRSSFATALAALAQESAAEKTILVWAAAEPQPSGRQLDLSAQWRRPLAGGQLRLGVLVTHQPGHRAAADPELTLPSGWRRPY